MVESTQCLWFRRLFPTRTMLTFQQQRCLVYLIFGRTKGSFSGLLPGNSNNAVKHDRHFCGWLTSSAVALCVSSVLEVHHPANPQQWILRPHPTTHWKLGAPGSKSLKETAFTAMLSRWKGEKGRPERQNSFRILSLLVHNARYVLGVTSQHLIYGQIGEMGCCGSQCSGWGSTELVKSTPVWTFWFLSVELYFINAWKFCQLMLEGPEWSISFYHMYKFELIFSVGHFLTTDFWPI